MEDQEQHTEEMPFDLQDFLAESALPGESFKLKLYRLKPKLGGRATAHSPASFLDTFNEEAPDESLIREVYGPGTYRVNLDYTNKKKVRKHKSRVIRIDPQPHDHIAGPPAVAASVTGQTFGPAEMLQMFQISMQTIASIIGNRPEPAPSGDLSSMAKSMGEVMLTNYKQTAGIIGEIQRSALGLPDRENEDEDDEPGILEYLRWAWSEFGEKVLKATPFIQKMYRQQVHKSGQLEALQENPGAYRQAVEEIRAEVGGEKINKLLRVLGVPLPEEIVEPDPAEGKDNVDSTQQHGG